MMTTLTLPIKPHDKQLPIISPNSRFNVIAAGRRFGKTEAEKLGDIYRVMEGQTVWWMNPTFDNTTEAWLDFLNFFQQFVPRDGINKSRREIITPTGGKLRMLGAESTDLATSKFSNLTMMDYVDNVVKNPYADYIKTALAVRKDADYPMWVQPNK